MTKLVSPSDIERIVGVTRAAHEHWGRAVSAEQTVYILHSQTCLDSGVDLRDCPFSVALDLGIDVDDWVQDVPALRPGARRTVPVPRAWPIAIDRLAVREMWPPGTGRRHKSSRPARG